MSTITRLGLGPLTPLDWAHLSLLPLVRPSIRIEDYRDGDQYVIRAEIPGIDPAKDVRVTFADGALRLDVERREDAPSDKDHAEFHYGSFFRIVPMPAGVQEKSITARYADGILEITATVGAIETTGRKIPIKIENGKKN